MDLLLTNLIHEVQDPHVVYTISLSSKGWRGRRYV